MFKFIEKDYEDKNVSSEYIDSIEKKFNIKFPDILREYYLKHNFADDKECCFMIGGIDEDFTLDTIIPLKYGTIPLEKEYEWVLENDEISNDFIPLAYDMDGERHFWNSKNGKVYYISVGNVENPILICESVEKYFEILNKCCDTKIIIENLNRPQENIDSASDDLGDHIDDNVEKNLTKNRLNPIILFIIFILLFICIKIIRG